MALHKEITLKSGITLAHWVIGEFSSDRENRVFVISVTPYISKEIYDAGGAPITAEKIVIRVEDIKYPQGYEWRNSLHYTEYFSPEALAGKNIYDVMYEYLKTNIEFFKEADDV